MLKTQALKKVDSKFFMTEERDVRLQRLQNLRERGSPYPNSAERSHAIA